MGGGAADAIDLAVNLGAKPKTHVVKTQAQGRTDFFIIVDAVVAVVVVTV